MKTIDPLDKRTLVLRKLREIPGIGPSLAGDLYSLGLRRIADLARKNPETLYRRLEKLTGARQDRCVLYTFRCAVYYARTPKPEPRLLKWWNWMDTPKATGKARKLQERPDAASARVSGPNDRAMVGVPARGAVPRRALHTP